MNFDKYAMEELVEEVGLNPEAVASAAEVIIASWTMIGTKMTKRTPEMSWLLKHIETIRDEAEAY